MQYLCDYPNCGRQCVVQVHGENLCQHHSEIRAKERSDAVNAMILQERLDHQRIEKAGEWRNGFKSVLP